MNITSLFRIDIFNYNLFLVPKIIWTRYKYRVALKTAKKNRTLKGIANGTLYICGNGPSLNSFDPSSFDDDYLVVNDFFRFPHKDPSHPPRFYMILDESYLDERFSDRYNGVFNPGFETTYLINGQMYKRVSNDYPNKKIFYFCPWGQLFSHKKNFKFDKIHSRTWNVVSEAILFGIFAGYKEIRLVGCDYSVFAANKHFYAQEQSHANLKDMLFKYCFTTYVHYEIAKYAKNKGVCIKNCTSDSLLDAYEFLELI